MTGSATVSPSDAYSPRSQTHVLLFMQETEDRALLDEWLRRQYTVSAGAAPTALDREFDLCLVDEPTFARHTEALVERKERAAPTFLPYLLVLDDRTRAATDRRVWEYVDEVVETPIEQAELHGRLTGLLARRTLSKALAAQTERMQQVIRAIPDPLLVLDGDGRVVEANPALREELCCTVDAVVESPLEAIDAFPADAVDALTRLAESDAGSRTDESANHTTREDGAEPPTATRSTVTFRHADGTVRTAEVGTARLTGPEHTGPHTLFVFRDVTGRINRERALERERDRLDEFADMLAHELRNPLNLAQGHLDRLTPGSERDETTIDSVTTAHTRMEQMIKELLAHARDESLGPIQTVHLDQIARVAWEGTPTAEATLELATGDATVEADPESLQTILENLFRNATEHAGPTVTVRVGALDDGGFYLEDDGPGIPVEDRERVFDRGVTTDSAGTGLGLALVRQVAEDHGWEIAATDSELGGVRFAFSTAPASDSSEHRPATSDDGPR